MKNSAVLRPLWITPSLIDLQNSSHPTQSHSMIGNYICHVLYRSLKARLRYFLIKLVIIAKEFSVVIEVTRLSCDGLAIIAQ